MPLQTAEEMPIISVKDLWFFYQNSAILRDVSFEVFKGEFIGVIGPNGGGKTTLLKLLMGFLKPSRGTIDVFGTPPKVDPGYTPRLAYVPQTIRYDREFPISVEEVVLSGLLSKLPWYGRFSSEDKSKAKKVLRKVGLEKMSQCSFGTLSGGEAQRILIARALISDPQLLLLDEPTASVDTQAGADIYAILKQLKGKMTILMVTHDLRTAIDHVERVLCVQGTSLVLKPEEVCKHFALGLYHQPLVNQPPLSSPFFTH